MPPEILNKIFEFLDVRSKFHAAAVCKVWCDIADIPSVWKAVEVSLLSSSTLFDAYVIRGIRRIRSPTSPFDVVEWTRQLDDFLSYRREVLTTPTAIEVRVELSGVASSITDEVLTGLVTCSADSLHTLVLQQCGLVTADSIDVISTACPNLVKLGLRDCFAYSTFHNASGHFFWNALRKLKRLRRLELQRIHGVNDEFFRCLVQDQAPANGAVPSAATPLSLTCLVIDQYSITNASLEYMSRGNLPDLTELDLLMCFRITHDAMRFLSSMKHLRRLRLPSLRPVTHDGRKQQSAKDEEGNYYSDVGLSTLATSGVLCKLHSLTVLEITDKSIELIARCATSSFQHLNIMLSDLSDTGLRHLLTGCRHLTSLSISNCNGFTLGGLFYLERRLKHLHSIFFHIGDLSTIRPGRLFKILLRLQRLRTLGISVRQQHYQRTAVYHVTSSSQPNSVRYYQYTTFRSVLHRYRTSGLVDTFLYL